MPTETRLRLALFTDSLEPSGVGRVMEMLARHLPGHRYEIFLVCADHPGADGLAERMQAHVAGVARYTVRGDDDLAALHALVEQLRSWRVEILHNHPGATWEGDWGTLAARCAGVPVVVSTEHLPCVLRLSHELEHRRRLNQLLAQIIAVSDSVRRSILAHRLAPVDAVTTVENGVEEPAWQGARDMPREHPPDASSRRRGAERVLEAAEGSGRRQARLELDLPQERPIVLALGRLVEQKDPAVLLQAVRRRVAAGDPLLALFAGDGALRGELEQLVKQLNLQAHVRFLGNRGDVPRLLAAADALAMPSRFEGLPLAALEAMAAGLPIVGCDAPGVRDAVAHGVTGWLAPIGDSAALARGLQLALTSETSRRWGQAARKRYERRFTAQRMAAAHDRVYTEVLACVPARGKATSDSLRSGSRLWALGSR